MLTSPQHRAAVLFITLTLTTVTAICGAFLVLDAPIPEWFVIVGRWIPALVSLLALRLVRLPGGLGRWWQLRPGGWRRLLGGSAAALVVLVACYASAVAVMALTGLVTPQPVSVLVPVVTLLVPMVLVFSLSTFGEEVGWRGFLQQLLAGQGFWRSSCLVAGVWVLFHVPLHGAMALQGSLPVTIAVVTTVGLFPLGVFLSAAVTRWGSVWPAVFAHALPFSALNLVIGVDELSTATHVLLAVVTGVVLLAAAGWLSRAPRGARSSTPREPEPAAG